MTRLASVAALALTLVVGCSTTSEPVNAAPKKAGAAKAAPDFALKDIDGRTVKLSDYKGKIVLLNFWATWCGPCKVEIPWFMEFENKYKDKGFAVIGVAMDEEGWDVVKPYLADRRINYRIVMGNDEVAKLYGGVESLPTTFLIDREGRISGKPHVGLVSKSEYENDITQLLEGKRAARTGELRAALRAD